MHILTWSTQEKINEIASRFAGLPGEAAAKKEIAVGDVGKIFFQLVEMILPAEFDSVRAQNLAEIIYDLINVLGDAKRTAGDADHEVVEVNFRDPLDSGCAYEDSGSAAGAGSETQTGQTSALSTKRLVEGNIQAKIPETKFVYGCSESFGIAQIDVVGVPGAVHAKAGIERRIRRPVRVDTVVLIAVIVGREQTETRVGIYAAAVFVIAEIYFPRAGRELPVPLPGLTVPGVAGRMKGSNFAEMGLKLEGDNVALGNTHCAALTQPDV